MDDEVVALSHSGWDVTFPPSDTVSQGDFDLVLHGAAWTDVDGAEADPQSATAVNVGGTANVAALGAPLVAFSTDYVFDGSKRVPYVESDGPNPLSAYGRAIDGNHDRSAAGPDAWIVRTSWLFGATGHNFVRTMLRLGAERDEVAVVDDQRGCPTFVGHLARAVRELVDSDQPRGVWHVAAGGDCTWADFAEAIFAAAELESAALLHGHRTPCFGASEPAPRSSRTGGTGSRRVSKRSRAAERALPKARATTSSGC